MSAFELKILFWLNKISPIQNGDILSLKAKNLLRKHLSISYNGQPKMNKEMFYSLADFSSNAFLSKKFGINFENNYSESANDLLADVLNDFRDIDTDIFEHYLDQKQILFKRQTNEGLYIFLEFFKYVRNALANKNREIIQKLL